MTDADALRARVRQLEEENAALRSAAERSRDRERFLDSVVENIPNMIFVKDAAELRFVRFNAAGERLLGYQRADLIGKNDRDFFPEAEAEFFLQKDRLVLEGGGVLDIPEEPIHTAAGARVLHTKKIPIHDDDGRPLYLLGISEDITERKLAEQQLAQQTQQLKGAHAELLRVDWDLRVSQARLGALLEHFPGALWTTDAALRFTYTAGALAAQVGLSGEGLIGTDIAARLKPAASGPSVTELHQLALAGEPQTYEFEAGDRTFEVRLERISLAPGAELAACGLVAVALDVTERRRDEVERIRGRLERAQKLEMLGLLAGGIAHDFNNLLTVILGNASLALLRLGAADPARVSVERVERSAQTAADLTRQLLAYSGKGRFVIEPVDLSQLVEDMGMLFKVSVSRKAVLKFNLVRDLPRCEADSSQIRQILINLITNASDALGDEPGTITLSTGLIQADRAYLSRAWLDEDLPVGPYVWLEVSDTGIGMPPETQNHMFDPFFTTKPRGHGLGLSATLGVVRGHHGAIRVYSERGHGTTIKVLFPAISDGREVTTETKVEPTRDARRGGVMVVDDEAEIREFASDVLRELGYTVFTAFDGEDAVALFRHRHAEIDGVLLDMTMPRLSGEETFRALRAIRADVKVMLSSGYNEQDATSRFAGRGLAGFLQKPYTASQLLESVSLLMRGTR